MAYNQFSISLPTKQDIFSFVVACERYEEDVVYVSGNYVQDAKSLLGMMAIPHDKIAEVTIRTEKLKVLDKFLDDIFEWIVKKENAHG